MADVKVQDVMTHLVVMLHPQETVHEAARRLAQNDISGAPVVEDGEVVGIVSESDLIRAVMPATDGVPRGSVFDVLAALRRGRPHDHHHATSVADIMSRVVFDVSPTASIWKAASIMERRGIKRLPVIDDDHRLVGIVSRGDVVRAMAKGDEQIRTDVIEAISVLGGDTIAGLRVDVRDGIVTLNGTTDRRSTRDLAVTLASRTPGVVDVINMLDFKIDEARAKPPLVPDPKDPRLDWHAASDVTESLR